MIDELAAWFARRLDVDGVEISDFKRHAEGWSWQTYTMTVSWSGGSAGYAVRRQPEDGLLAPYDIEAQYRLHQTILSQSDVPMPALVALELDASILGMPFYVMDRVDGTVPVQWGADDPTVFPTEAARRELGLQFVDTLAAIHAIDPTATGIGPESLDALEARYDDSLLVELPLVREAFRWLRANEATSGRTTLCHGDYRIGNFMVQDGRIVAVFDWELASIGDPVSDIAWAGFRLFRGRSPLFSHLLPKEDFLDRYEERAGLTVEEDVLRYWTVYSHVKAVVPHVRATRVFEDGTSNDLRLAAMGHQSLYVLRSLAQEIDR